MNGDKKYILYAIYALSFVFSLSMALPAYINSTFLKEYTTEKFVGILFTIGSLLTLIAFINVSKILKRIGNYKLAIFLTIAHIILLIGLATANTMLIIAPIFALYMIVVPLLKFNLDIFLEHYSTDNNTGEIRGKFFTAANAAWVIAPAVTGIILTNGDYWKIYILSAISMLPVWYMLYKYFRKFEDPKYDGVKFIDTLKLITKERNIYNIFMANFLMFFFYSWMIIYMPIYLHDHLGFDWSSIGFMFTIMLLPFILLQFPTGLMADIKYGEKEFLVFGFIVTALSSAVLPFITSVNFFVWAGALFVTRIGASIIEIMTETYFFKKIDSTDAHMISVFRNNRSIAYVIAPTIASCFLFFIDLKYLFLALGVIMLLGIKYSLSIEDTL